jgi:hypothetical protein
VSSSILISAEATRIVWVFSWKIFWDVLSRTADVVALIGFPIALFGVWQAYKAAAGAKRESEAARQAVDNFRHDLNLSMSVADFTRALAISDEIKRLIRSKNFHVLPDRLSEMRRLLIAIRASDLGLSTKQKAIFQGAIVNSKRLEGQVDDIIASGNVPTEISALTQLLCDDVDSLQEILTLLQNQIGNSL